MLRPKALMLATIVGLMCTAVTVSYDRPLRAQETPTPSPAVVAPNDKPSPQPSKPGLIKKATAVRIVVQTNPVQAYKMARVTVNAEEGDVVEWEVDPTPDDQVQPSDGYLVFTGKPGAYKVTADLINFDTKRKGRKSVVVTLLGTSPVPPGPNPPPVPPNPAPIPDVGFRVLIVYEKTPTKPEDVLTSAQQTILYGKTVRDYLDTHCTKEVDGGPGYRIWDANQVVAGDSDVWVKAFNRPRSSNKWLIVSNGTTGYEGPLPANKDEFLALVKKYGGN